MKRLFLFILIVFWVFPTPIFAEAPLRLNALIAQVLAQNPEILAAQARRTSARTRISQAMALDDPEVALTQWSFPSLNFLGADETWLTLSQKIPGWNKREILGRLTATEWDIARIKVEEIERRVVAETKSAYFDLFLAQKHLNIHQEQIDLAKEVKTLAQARFAIGTIEQSDVLQTQMEILELESGHAALERQREAVEAKIHALLSAHVPLDKTETLEVPELTVSLDRLEETAIAHQPELKLLSLLRQYSTQKIAQARLGLTPDFMAEVAYMDIHHGKNAGMISLKMTLPWINRKKYLAGLREMHAESASATAEYQAAVNKARLAVKEFYIQWQNEKRRAELYRFSMLPLAEQSFEATRVGYQAGTIDFFTLIAAGRALKDVKFKGFEALAAAYQAIAQLEQAIGQDLMP